MRKITRELSQCSNDTSKLVTVTDAHLNRNCIAAKQILITAVKFVKRSVILFRRLTR